MAGLQRSAQTFRRSGSSGLVWDERFLTEATGAAPAGRRHHHQPELRHSRSVGSVIVVAMQRRGGGGEEEEERDDKKRKLATTAAKPNRKDKDHHHQKRQEEELQVPAGTGRKPAAFRTRDVAPAAAEPPSPRVPAGCCAPCAIVFRDAAGARRSPSLLPRRANKKQ